MKYVIGCAVATMALAAGSAQADLVNGDFSSGADNWTQYGGSEGPYGVGFFGGSAAVVAYGTFSGAPNYSGYTQNVGLAGDFSEGDTISFGGEMYIENGKDLFAGNTASIQLTFWYGDGSAYGFSVAAGTIGSDSNTDEVYSFNLDYVLDSGAAEAARISFDFSYVQNDIPAKGVESGAAWGTNFYANIVPAPGAMALLGVAGLAGSRRRRA